MKTKKLEIEIVERSDKMWTLCAPVSSVRIGETDRELVKKKANLDKLSEKEARDAKTKQDT